MGWNSNQNFSPSNPFLLLAARQCAPDAKMHTFLLAYTRQAVFDFYEVSSRLSKQCLASVTIIDAVRQRQFPEKREC